MTLPGIERHKDGYYTNAIHAVVDTLPVVQVQLEAFDGQKIIPRTAWIKPNPYNTGPLYTGSPEGQFHLFERVSIRGDMLQLTDVGSAENSISKPADK
ncbi:hypothetical protein [uncultured Fibrella sp.]|uniref:hypothetical protein n=1 Tax=uncultured Fibrella sp. TaxID=1284596 RepID=UPI0035C99CDF